MLPAPLDEATLPPTTNADVVRFCGDVADASLSIFATESCFDADEEKCVPCLCSEAFLFPVARFLLGLE